MEWMNIVKTFKRIDGIPISYWVKFLCIYPNAKFRSCWGKYALSISCDPISVRDVSNFFYP